jgi:hypothetical protein
MCKKMMSVVSMCTCVALSLSGLVQVAIAAGPGGVVVVAQDGSGDYTCIQAAIDDYDSMEIIIMPGVYKENINITKDIVMSAVDGPLTTIIDGSEHRRWSNGCGSDGVLQNDAVIVGPGYHVTLTGLCVTNGTNGIGIRENAWVKLQNCVFWANKYHGIAVVDNWLKGQAPTTFIYNCVCVDNGGSGVLIGQGHFNYAGNYNDDVCPPMTIMNTILTSNSGYAIAFAQCDRVVATSSISLDYNCYFGNGAGNFPCSIGLSGQPISQGLHSITKGSSFVHGSAGDFRLASWSSCIDTGAPGTGFMDPDGTTNDIGAYGGPGAATFFESPTDGPMVRELTVTPGSVAQGSTLKIQAKGSIR